MAVVVNQAIELYGILKVFREVQADEALSPQHKLWMAKDLRKSLPARVMCGQCNDTYDIILSIITNEMEALTNATVPSAPSQPAREPVSAPIVAETKEVGTVPAAPKAQAKAKAPKAKTRRKK